MQSPWQHVETICRPPIRIIVAAWPCDQHNNFTTVDRLKEAFLKVQHRPFKYLVDADGITYRYCYICLH